MKKIFKKSLSVFLALCFVYSFPSFAANAEYSAGDFRLEARDDGVVIVGYQGSEENLTIPSVLHSEKTGEDAPVVEIGECAFGYNNTLETLTFSRNLKTIGDEAFCGCGKLTSITFSEGLQTIGVSAFAGCASLETVELPDSLLTLSAGAFENCDALRYVDTGNGVTTVSAAAFRGCDELKTVVFGKSVEAINKMAFAGCFKISDITAGHSIKTIASDAFDGSLDPTKVKCYFNSAYYDFAKNEGYSAIHTFVFSDITIEISSPTKDQYNVGETFDSSGIKVIASYEDSYDRDVTELSDIGINGTTSKPGEITVSAAYEENGTEISKIKRIPVVGEAAAYTATFKADGEVVETVKFTVEDETITEPTVPPKEGYTAKWETYTLKAENITINAVYTPIEFTATFKADGKTVETVNFTVEDETITEPTVPPKEGYTAKWETYTLKAENITINAVYTPIEFTATFKADGEVVGTVKFTVETTEITEPTVPPKEGHTGAWEPYILKAENITINAVYTAGEYIITWSVDGKETKTAYDFGKPITPPTVPDKTGYSFDGWTPEVPGTMPAENVTFTAIYTPIEFTATFKADGVTVETVKFTVEDEAITEPAVPTKTGYTGKWETYTLKAENITVNAVYTPIEYTATFKADGNTVGTVKFTVEDETITEPDVPKKEGYTGKWETYTLKAENITVNAVYEPMIHYASCVADGTEIARIPYRTGQKSISLPDVPKKEGYEGHWPSYSLSVGGITIVAFYVPIEYTATFKADGKTVGTVKFTVETTKITEPAVPKKDGYTGKWETYTLKASDITVNAVYTRILPTGITLNKTSLSMRYKDKFDLKYTLAPEGLSGYKVVYKSSNASVAAVDATSGQVTAKLKGKGSAVITATVVDTLTDQPVKGADGKELSATCNVGVSLSFIQKIIVYVLFGWIWY